MKLVVEVPQQTVMELDKRLGGYATRSELIRALIRDHIAMTPDPSAPQVRQTVVIPPGAAARGRTALAGGIPPEEMATLHKWVQEL